MSNTIESMKIFEIINAIEALVQESPAAKRGSAARVINSEELFDLLGDLKVTIPEDIRRANSVMIEAETTVANAEDHARDLVAEAQEKAESLVADATENAEMMKQRALAEFEQKVSEAEILAETQRRAELLALKAEHNATLVYESAKQYADEVLADIGRFLAEYQHLIDVNRGELNARVQPQIVSMPEQTAPAAPAAPAAPVQDMSGATRRVSVVTKADIEAAEEKPETPVFDEDEEPAPKKGLFGGLFKKGKRNDDDDYDDDEDDYDDEDDEDYEPKRKSLFGRKRVVDDEDDEDE